MKLRKVKADSVYSCFSNGKPCEFRDDKITVKCTKKERGVNILCNNPKSITFQRVEDPVKTLTLKKYALKIAWANLQDPNGFVSEDKMKEAIGMGWYSEDCPYCAKYIISCRYRCPLYKNDSCCNRFWWSMNISKTWGEWIINARKLVKYIKENG